MTAQFRPGYKASSLINAENVALLWLEFLWLSLKAGRLLTKNGPRNVSCGGSLSWAITSFRHPVGSSLVRASAVAYFNVNFMVRNQSATRVPTPGSHRWEHRAESTARGSLYIGWAAHMCLLAHPISHVKECSRVGSHSRRENEVIKACVEQAKVTHNKFYLVRLLQCCHHLNFWCRALERRSEIIEILSIFKPNKRSCLIG